VCSSDLLGGEPQAAADLARRVAQGDLTVRLAVRPRDSDSLMARLREMQVGLIGVVSGVRRNAERVAAASERIAKDNADLTGLNATQTTALQDTAASVARLGEAVARTAAHARDADGLATSASAVAVRGGEVVGEVVGTMREINDNSRRITDIIGTIDAIAFQTNILALNAAVEAARAGDQGRGFAVVAAEVRLLAHRSADAAREIKGLITSSVERVAQGAACADQAGETMRAIVASIERVAQIVGAIGADSAEQSAGVAGVEAALGAMDRAAREHAALVGHTAAAAQELKGDAAKLVEAVAVFRMEGASEAAPAHIRG
jgi:methyl-accepting chemotaxis protein